MSKPRIQLSDHFTYPRLLRFVAPSITMMIFTSIYGVVDGFFVSNYVGKTPFAALNFIMPFIMVLGGTGFMLGTGGSALVAKEMGCGHTERANRIFTMMIAFVVVTGLILTALGVAFIRPIARLMGASESIMADCVLYGRITIAFTTAFMLQSVFQSFLVVAERPRVGLLVVVAAGVANMVLDALFVAVFHWGIAGAAIATVIAQCCSALYCLMCIWRIKLLRLKREDWHPDQALVRRLLALGAPVAFQNGIIGVGGFAVQYVLNGFGLVFIAGFTATNKIYGLLELAAISYGFAMATYAGQNLGAARMDRIKKGMRAAVLMGIATSATISVLMIAFGRNILSIFISGEPEVAAQALHVAYTYLSVMAYTLVILYFLHIYRSALQGMGDTVIPMVSGILELVMRIAVALILPKLIGENGIYFAEPAAWLGAVLMLVGGYYYRIHKISVRLKAENPAAQL